MLAALGYSKAMADEAGTIKGLKAIRADLINPAISQRHLDCGIRPVGRHHSGMSFLASALAR